VADGCRVVTFDDVRRSLEAVGYEWSDEVRESSGRFSDGTRYRIEIPSTEGPAVFRAVVDEAQRREVHVQRVSQGSGVMMLTDSEIGEMVRIGADHAIEVSLFLGPRAAWGPGGQAASTSTVAGAARGTADLAACLAEAKRACDLGIRSLLVADVGVLAVLNQARAAGELPPNLLFKTSVVLPVANAATARVLQDLGAGTINVATDLSARQLGEIRSAVSPPLDVYVEVPDDQGGFVRYYEVPHMVRAAAPMYVKLGVRNSPGIYPTGMHIEDLAVRLGRERVRRAELCLRLMDELDPELIEKPGAERPEDLAIPEV
jgi:Peptidase family U32